MTVALARITSASAALAAYYHESRKWKLERPETFAAGDTIQFFPAWVRSIAARHTEMLRGEPWLTFAAIRALQNILVPGARVFEYGAGGSSIFFAERGAEVVSIEHSEDWAHQVENVLHRRGSTSCSICVIPPRRNAGARHADCSDPTAYSSSDDALRDYSFEEYARAIDRYPNGHFDVVLIDGRARPSCIQHAAPKVSCAGVMIVDNAERTHYRSSMDALCRRGWSKRSYFGPGPYNRYFWETCFLRPPAAV